MSRDALAVVFARRYVRYLPVRERDVLRQYVRDAADSEEHGRAGDYIQVRYDQRRGRHGYRALVTVYHHRAHVRREPVGTRERRYRHEWDAHVEGVIARKVHERAAADGDDDVRVFQLGYDALDEAFFRVQSLRLEHYLLVGPDVDHAGQVVCIGIVEHGAAACQPALLHAAVEMPQGVVLDDYHSGLQRVFPSAGAGPGILRAVNYQAMTSFISHLHQYNDFTTHPPRKQQAVPVSSPERPIVNYLFISSASGPA